IGLRLCRRDHWCEHRDKNDDKETNEGESMRHFLDLLRWGNKSYPGREPACRDIREDLQIAREKQFDSVDRNIRAYKQKTAVRRAGLRLRHQLTKKSRHVCSCRQSQTSASDQRPGWIHGE